jgi:hypothetical protein
MKNSGIYTFHAYDQIYHNIRSFGREDSKEPRHLELYFYDNDPSLEHRYRQCHEEKCQKDKEVIERLVAILCDNHTHNNLGVWAKLNTSRTIMSH